MKTKFSSIVALRKRDMQECERSIMQNENKIASKKMQLSELEDELHHLCMPQNGTFYAFRAYEDGKRMLLFRIDEAKRELDALFANKNLLQTQYQKCHIEYEKVSFLDKKAQETLLKKLKLAEKKEIDDIAIMLYNKEGKAI